MVVNNDNLRDDLNRLCDKYGVSGIYGVFIFTNNKWVEVALSKPLQGKVSAQTAIDALRAGSSYLSGMADSFQFVSTRYSNDYKKNDNTDTSEMPH